jgi:hypothetical protein
MWSAMVRLKPDTTYAGPAKAGHYVLRTTYEWLRTQGHAERFGQVNGAAAGEL